MTSYWGNSITYDAIGNPLSWGDYGVLTWQGRQLESYTDSESEETFTYTYNSDGIRTSKTIDGVEHIYHLSGTQVLSEEWNEGTLQHLLIYIYDASGSPIGMAYRDSTYFNGDFDFYLFAKNVQGDILYIYNTSGTRLVTYTYDAWGNVTTSYSNGGASTAARYNPFRYRGYYYDTETGFYYLNSRYYDPAVGRFLNADGYVNANRDLIGYNMFAYCSNNPVNTFDPLGQWYIKDGIKWLTDKVLRPVTDMFRKKLSALGDMTNTVGISISGAFGGGGELSIGIATDNQGNIGFLFSRSLYAGSPSLSLSVYRTITNAPSIEKLDGMSMVAGGSVDVYGVSVGGEFTVFSDNQTNDVYLGGTVSAGVGAPIPIEFHGGLSWSNVWMFNVFDVLDELYDRINAW